jgi:hypothetical protein
LKAKELTNALAQKAAQAEDEQAQAQEETPQAPA